MHLVHPVAVSSRQAAASMKTDACDAEKGQLLANSHIHRSRKTSVVGLTTVVALVLTALLLLSRLPTWRPLRYSCARRVDVAQVQQCSIDNLKADLSFLDTAKPIEASEFLERRDRLARALAADGVDGFVFEPGYTFQ